MLVLALLLLIVEMGGTVSSRRSYCFVRSVVTESSGKGIYCDLYILSKMLCCSLIFVAISYMFFVLLFLVVGV